MIKTVKSKDYNYLFNYTNGFFARWGSTKEEDPQMSNFGPEIADIEISTSCSFGCSWCYKTNTKEGSNMSLETFKNVFHKLPKNLTQIAFGIGDIGANKDLWKIMSYCRENDYNKVVPNITVHGRGLNKTATKNLATLCGAIAVSRYNNTNVCYNAVDKLYKASQKEGATLKQVNIHQLLSEETYESCFQLLEDVKSDKRLEGLNAVVFLLLKPKGGRNKMNKITDVKKFQKLFEAAQAKGIAVGMDSCSAPLMLKTAVATDQKELIPSIEPCESTLFSIYMNVDGEVFPCSFTEGTPGWETGIDMKNVSSFLKDVWFSERLAGWRGSLTDSTKGCGSCEVQSYCRACPIYDITPCLETSHKPERLNIIYDAVT